MAQAMACEATDIIAGMAYASNTLGPQKATACEPSLPITVVGFSGTKDVGSAADTRNNKYSSDETAWFWASANGCTGNPAVTTLPDTLTDGTKTTDTKKVWGTCESGTSVTLYTIEGGGHAWPASPVERRGEVKIGSAELPASQLIWDTLAKARR